MATELEEWRELCELVEWFHTELDGEWFLSDRAGEGLKRLRPRKDSLSDIEKRIKDLKALVDKKAQAKARRIKNVGPDELPLTIDELRHVCIRLTDQLRQKWLRERLTDFADRKSAKTTNLDALRKLQADYSAYKRYGMVDQAIEAADSYFEVCKVTDDVESRKKVFDCANALIELWLCTLLVPADHTVEDEDRFFKKRNEIVSNLEDVGSGRCDQQIMDYDGFPSAGPRYKALEVIARLSKLPTENARDAFMRVKKAFENHRGGDSPQ